MATAEKFNGTTLSFGGSLTPLQSLSYDDSPAEVDCTGAGSSSHTYESGISNETLKAELVGNQTVTEGAAGATVVVWGGVAGNTWGSWAGAVVTDIRKSGRIDDKVVYEITFKRTA